jgi:Txe/YoeB family toxin of toxin-antitoxin system
MEIVFTRQAEKDFEKIKRNPILLKKVIALLDLIEVNPFSNPPRYEKLIGFDHVYSRRINQQHRLIYQTIQPDNIIKIIRMWTHYE